MKQALGTIEVVGKATAVTALDAACKTAEVSLLGVENIIGSGGVVGVNIQIAGEVAAVQAAIDAANDAATRIGTVLYSSVIPRPNDELEKLIEKFKNNLKNKEGLDSEEKEEISNVIETDKNTK
ncbi:BMC domain-containing protein [Microaceticoccus formicicus]|uniref:BMC domain-containing protein n=1 Tax=Microaceticoccus formicicus TaxID=3118105 RepID=UPI003CD02C8D|nr:BMC domain-containing protein [Peptoniphilaceae bacterium AMB_02]